MKYKVSVIVPAYNAEPYLKQCMDSLIRQSLQELEIIIINDGSTDQTESVARELKEQYPDQIIVKTTKNQGAAAARREGLLLARGEYVGFVDSDDFVSPVMFETLYEKAAQEDGDIACCGYRRIDGKDVQTRGCDGTELGVYGGSIYEQPDMLVYSTPYLWNKIFKRDMIEERGLTFEELPIYEDLVFTYQSFLCAGKIVYTAQPLYHYTVSRDGALTQRFSFKRFALMRAYDLLREFYEKQGAYEQFRQELFFILIKHVYVSCEERVRLSQSFLKMRYIRESFSYLRSINPDLDQYRRYYQVYHNSKSLYESRWYWYGRTVCPWAPEIRRMLGKLKRSSRYSRSAARYLRHWRRDPVDDKLILLQSQQGTNMNGSMFYLLKELCENPFYDDYRKVVAYSAPCKEKVEKLLNDYGLLRQGVSCQRIHGKEYGKTLACAGYLITDTSFTTYFMKRPGQTYLNTWHGTPLKTLGKATAEDYYDIANLQKNFVEADYLLFPSPFMRDVMARDFMLEGTAKGAVVPCGYPRNEIFFDRDRAKQIRKACKLAGKEVIAYMPTWRGNVRTVDQSQTEALLRILEQFDAQLSQDQILYVNLHPYVGDALDYGQYRHIRRFPQEYETYDFLNCCDALVTDYSSVFFDYGITERPVVLFVYDKEEYLRSRGMYLDLDELPYVQADSVSRVIEALSIRPDGNAWEAFHRRFQPWERPAASEDLLGFMIRREETGIRTERINQDGRKKALILYDPVESRGDAGVLMETVKRLQTEGYHCFVSYDTDRIKGFQQLLKNLPEGVDYMGRLNPFQLQSFWESMVTALLEYDPKAGRWFGRTVRQMMQREMAHAYPGISFDRVETAGTVREREQCLKRLFRSSGL